MQVPDIELQHDVLAGVGGQDVHGALSVMGVNSS